MAITVSHQDQKSLFGDDDHLKLSTEISFSEMIYRLLSETKPSATQLKIFELILNLSIDHGPDTPSAKKTISEAKSGQTISESLAEGIEEINDNHGGAGEGAMKIFYQIEQGELAISDFVKAALSSQIKIPGFGHRLYDDLDPRAELILSELTSLPAGDKFAKIAKDLQSELQSQTQKNLLLNIDGAIAAALCSFGWQPVMGKAVFLIARTPGLIAHYLNNRQNKP